jgi:hypothetical protein
VFNIILYLYSIVYLTLVSGLHNSKKTILLALEVSSLSHFIFYNISSKMSNGSKTNGKAVLRNYVVDYRNAKYQGELSEYERKPHGMGMLLDIDFLLVIANWQEGLVENECIVVYPNGNIFYGFLKDNRPASCSAFQISKYKTIYSFLKQDEHSIFIIDCQLRHTLTLVRVHNSHLSKMLLTPTVEEDETVHLLSLNDRAAKKKIEIM